MMISFFDMNPYGSSLCRYLHLVYMVFLIPLQVKCISAAVGLRAWKEGSSNTVLPKRLAFPGSDLPSDKESTSNGMSSVDAMAD
jgi:hypothetical protein